MPLPRATVHLLLLLLPRPCVSLLLLLLPPRLPWFLADGRGEQGVVLALV